MQEHPDATESALAAVTSSYADGGARARGGGAQVPSYPDRMCHLPEIISVAKIYVHAHRLLQAIYQW